MDDIDYGAVFGVGAEDPDTAVTEGAEVTEPADPSSESNTTDHSAGAEAQEAAAPAEGDTKPPEPRKERKTEEDARFAAARRRAEADRDAAIAKARADVQAQAQKSIDQFFRDSGLINPFTKAPITTKDEYTAYRQQYLEQQKQNMLQKTGMSQEEYKAFVDNLPEVRAAREAKAAADQAAMEAREQQARSRVEAQLKEIQGMDPAIKTLQDLSKMETYPKLYDMVKRGYSIVDAYKLANYDALTNRAAEASRKAAVTSVQSKQHLTATRARGDGAVSVPESVLEEYRVLNPGASKEEIQRHYQKYMKSMRKE